MTQAEIDRLSSAPERLLSAVERQKRHLLRLALLRPECPGCGKGLSQIDACAEGIKGYSLGSASIENTFRCPGCGLVLVIVVPFFAAAGPWHWGRKEE